MSDPILRQMSDLGQRVQGLSDGQHQLAGGLNHVSEAQAQSQSAMLQLMEKRLAEAGIKGGKTSADDELSRILGK